MLFSFIFFLDFAMKGFLSFIRRKSSVTDGQTSSALDWQPGRAGTGPGAPGCQAWLCL